MTNGLSTGVVPNLLGNPPAAAAPSKWIWKYACLSKQKYFFWLLIQDRLNSRDLLIRKHFYIETGNCVLCNNNDLEDVMHLFFSCDFSQNFWMNLGITWISDMHLTDMLMEGRQRMNMNCYREIIIA